jgi:hypothetical protein
MQYLEQLILPSLKACETLLEEKKILAGGPAVYNVPRKLDR